MPDVATAGQLTSAALDVRNAMVALGNAASSGGDVSAALNNMVGALNAVATAILDDAAVLKPALVTVGAASAVVNLSKALSDLRSAKTEEGQISAALAVASAVGGVVVAIPTPATRGVGTLLLVGGAAAKEIYDKRKSLQEAMQSPQLNISYDSIRRQPLRRPQLDKVKTARRVYADPLALDLDGDGIELTRLSGATSVKFDADGDGLRTATAWIAGDDALLVLDRNGNGRIDNGSELFGDQTLLSNGQLAADGIAALADLDTNGDGVFNALDARYGDVRLWQDRNQDGVSQADELIRLVDAGVASISLNATTPNTVLTDAVLEREGTWTGTDGNTHKTGSFDFAQDTYWTAFDSVTVADAAKLLPNIGGSGWVRDLQEAATLNPTLVDLYTAVDNATTRSDYQAAVGKLYREWAGSSAYQNASDQARAHGTGYGLIASAPQDAQEAGWLNMAIMVSEADRNAFRATLSAIDLAKFDAMRERMTAPLEAVFAYEAFTGTTFLNYGKLWNDAFIPPPLTTGGGGNAIVYVDVTFDVWLQENRIGSQYANTNFIVVNLAAATGALGMNIADMAWNQIMDSAADAFMGVRLEPYLSEIGLAISEQGVSLDFQAMDSALDSAVTQNAYEGSALVFDLVDFIGEDLMDAGWKGGDRLSALMAASATDADIARAMADCRVARADGTASFTSDDLLVAGSAGNDTINFFAGSGTAFAGRGDDVVSFAQGNDRAYGGMGKDTLNGGAGNDQLWGGTGDDTLNGGDGDDRLDGGAGNDSLTGGRGNDTYLFGIGDGQDSIVREYDPAAGKKKVLEFKSGVRPSDVKAVRSGDDLWLYINGASDRVRVYSFFYNEDTANSYNPLQEVRFADGTVWDLAKIESLAMAGSVKAQSLVGLSKGDVIDGGAGADSINGGRGDDVLGGGEGADSLVGDLGNDTLRGGSGYDSLSGGDGSDTLDGGTGNDTLLGGYGNDTYLFGRGDGEDTISSDYETTAGRLDTLRFKSGIAPSDVIVSQSWGSLVLSIAGTADKVTVSGFFSSDSPSNSWNPVQQVVFDDGTTWDTSALVAKVLAGSSAADVITGTVGADVITGQTGDDTLKGQAGADTLDGGSGNDRLSGGEGNDTYLFGLGDGQDIIETDYDSGAGKLNVLSFKSTITPGMVTVSRSGNDLVLSVVGKSDKITVSHFFYWDDPANNYNPVQQVKFLSDNTTWDIPTLLAKAFAGTSSGDTINGTKSNDVINGQSGNDTLTGGEGNDTLKGGIGNDTLSGGAGNDTLEGGVGNDRLSGGAGNDTFLFGLGDGQDYIDYDYDSQPGRLNVLQFKSGVTPDMIVLRRSGRDLIISIAGTSDTITVDYYFDGDTPDGSYSPVQQVRFANGTIWDTAALLARAFAGTSSDDSMDGTKANDIINGQIGNDYLSGRSGDDNLSGGVGDDGLYGDAGNDTLEGGLGNDRMAGGLGNDTFIFGLGDGQDVIEGDSEATTGQVNVLQFKSGITQEMIRFSRVGSDLIVFVAGTAEKVTVRYFFYGEDPAHSKNPLQQIRFSDGSTWDAATIKSKLATTTADLTLDGTNGDDIIIGAMGNDVLSGGWGNDTLEGGAGTDRLSGGNGNDTYVFGLGDGQDTIDSDYETVAGKLNVLSFKSSINPNMVVATRVDDSLVLSVIGTSDKITVKHYFGGEAYSPVQEIRFQGDGTVWSVSAVLAKVFAGTVGSDNTIGTAGNDAISGLAGDDSLSGRAGDDTLSGGLGNDVLTGEEGNDILEGGAGSDRLSGGAGDDTYLFGLGDGVDVIESAYDSNTSKLNVLSFKSSITPSMVVATRSNSDLVLSILGSSDRITIKDFFNGDNPQNVYNPVQQIRFLSDNSTWDIAALTAKVFSGTSDADMLSGSIMSDSLMGQAGNDSIYGRGGNDVIDGGAGDDQLSGEDGNDVVRGGLGDDSLYGGVGADTLDGGAGNDRLLGGDGNDTYLFGRGDGQDTIYSDSEVVAGKKNVLTFKSGVTSSQVEVSRVSSSLVLTIAGTSDKVTVSDFFAGDDPANSSNPIQLIKFSDGSSWDHAAIKAKLLQSDYTAQSLTGYASADVIDGGDGADTLSGQGGNDVLDGGAGADTLNGGAGDDTLKGGEGNDTLNGDSGADVLDGGADNDRLSGGAGNDIYLFGKGDGEDFIAYDYDSSATKLNALQFKAGVSAENVIVSRLDGNLVLSIAESADKVTVESFFSSDDPANTYNPIQQVTFSDGTTWSAAELARRAMLGDASDQTLNGTLGADIVSGFEGNDYLYGNGGNDTLDGGSGDDHIMGGVGSDTYLIGKNEGQDTIRSTSDGTVGKMDTLQFKEGVLAADVSFDTSGSSLLIKINGGDDGLITVHDFLYQDNPANTSNPLQQIKFFDGTTWGQSEILARLYGGTVANDTLNGTVSNDTIKGMEGADILIGKAGNDLLDGGAGGDDLQGGVGNDTYLFGRGSDADRVLDYDTTAGNVDVLSIGAGVTVDQLWFRRVGSDLEVSIIGSADKTTISNWYTGNAYHVEQIKTADGKTLLDSKVDALVSAMAGFAPPAAGQSSLPANYQSTLSPVIAANWQ